MKVIFTVCLFVLSLTPVFSQTATQPKPKLIVGLVIDQMRWDFLMRYQEQYSRNGFNRLMKEGFSCNNTFISYVPTYTAAGHASIYTGSVPAINGIVGNSWFDRKSGKSVYCSDDSSATGVGSQTAAGKMSPRNLLSTTIGDELRLSNNFQSKVIGISLKDRGAIFPAGHSANAAYWADDEASGKWISSSYYMNELPEWVQEFNRKELPIAYMKKDWELLLPSKAYTQSTEDDRPFESHIPGEKSSQFPHRLSQITDKKIAAFRFTPFANTYTFEFAKAAIEANQMGKGTYPDMLTISLSTPDYIGHEFGPNSVEIQDTYLRLDADIAGFLNYLDQRMGKGNYLLFLTADHGVAHVPGFLESKKIPAGNFSGKELVNELNTEIESKWGYEKMIVKIDNFQLYLNEVQLQQAGSDAAKIKSALINMLLQKPYLAQAFELSQMNDFTLPAVLKTMCANGYFPKRSGDIQIIPLPNFLDKGKTGTTHGVWNPYDTHIPLVWFGSGISKGQLYRETYITDIAATLAALLHIQMPNGCVGKVITEVVK